MLTKNVIAVLVSMGLLLACSKSEPQSGSANSGPASVSPGGHPPDYKLICERLGALAPEARKVSISGNCVADYQKMLPSCQNASAVNNCYANMKEWGERLACLDSCVRN